nr:ribonuclease H-like domain-containing protein [Tanacetum cinerariifolium]
MVYIYFHLLLISYSDADWAGCMTTRRSTSGYCVFLGNNLLSWSSKRQPTLSRSSAEAEYRGVANVVARTCWIWNLLHQLYTPLSSTTIVYCDNKGQVWDCYKGEYDFLAEIDVEIKRSNMDFNQGAIEFWAEIEMLSKFRHSYIIFLLGYCEESGNREMILAYEYITSLAYLACTTTNVYTRQVIGTFGYLDAEYFSTHRLIRKSDFYAFGVVLLEVLCGRPALDFTLDEQQHRLAGWAKQKIAYACLCTCSKDRPTMTKVLANLEFVLAWTLRSRQSASDQNYIGRAILLRRHSRCSRLKLQDYNAKLLDFVLAKLGPYNRESHVTTRVAGSYGFMAPEYIATGHLYIKSDDYAFGMVTKQYGHDKNLLDWVDLS